MRTQLYLNNTQSVPNVKYEIICVIGEKFNKRMELIGVVRDMHFPNIIFDILIFLSSIKAYWLLLKIIVKHSLSINFNRMFKNAKILII